MLQLTRTIMKWFVRYWIAEQMRACVQEGRSATQAYAGLVKNPAAREIDPD